MIFINRERIATLESKFHFQIQDWNLPKVDSFEVTNVDCIFTCLIQKFTREIRNRWRLLVSFGLTWHGIFLNFQEHFLCIYSTLVFKKYSSQFYNSRLLLHVKKYLQLIFCWANTNHIRYNKPPIVCHLHVNICLMSIISQSAFLIWNKATVRTLQYSIWKWNFESNNAIRSQLMKVIPK